MLDRLETFRDYMVRLDAAANPARTLERGFYVEPPGQSLGKEIADRLALRPTSTHLLIGGVGSGKTTQLLVACNRLSELRDTWGRYIDVSEHHDIGNMRPGVLMILAGLALADEYEVGSSHEVGSSPGADNAAQYFRRSAKGYFNPFYEYDDDDDRGYVPGILLPPDLGLSSELRSQAEELRTLREAVESGRSKPRHLVCVFDSLDRLADPFAFEQVVEGDVRAIRSANIGVVLAGPLRALYGLDRPITGRFDGFYQQPPVDVAQDAAGNAFLINVLRARLPAEVMPDDVCLHLARWSGGVLRDLVALAQLACEEAYLSGSDWISVAEVERAVDAFGRKHMLGLGPDELEVLLRVLKSGSFVQTSAKDLALLVTRRVLEYQGGRTRYAVHPTIRPLLEELAA